MFSLMSKWQFNTLWAAQAEILLDKQKVSTLISSPTNELMWLELARLGYSIVEMNASGGYIVSVETDLKTINTLYN